MELKIVGFPRDASAEQLAENFLEYAKDGHVKWAVMVIMEPDDTMRFEWSRLPSNLAAIGAVEFLKRRLMEE
ncbi:hypothetical protein C7399_109171 [Paraburkholderia tropica]|uniref:Uncharacterized protein n=1 Tax=Paraburkholderia tropica TaxID=92647 RepID=A0ABX5MS94_9BURK|nr:hypothetical protein [Paraburkholderia tropica]PXX15836.1 hypothetical protein C7400_109171 [Paraburkholderia tropica]PZW82095.1 hypothetical protein C7399_109171 [Paraburkholderia tropica]